MAEESWNALRVDLARGREQAFAELYERLAAPMLGVARRLAGSAVDAEDAVQQTFLDLYRHRRALAAARDLRSYALTALRRNALRARRRRGEPLEAEPPEPAASASAPEEGPESLPESRLARALDALPPEQREVLALKLDGGLTFAQVGELLGISPNTAASRYRYALEHLRGRLGGAR